MECGKIKTEATSRGPVEYLDTGSGDAVLCLHGAMGGHDQADTLGRTIGPAGCRYLALSRPGYLGTPLTTGKTPEEQADLYAEFLDRLGIGQVIVMAISGGGPSALHFALRHRDRCRGLVLASTCGGRTETKIPFFFHVMTLLAGWPGFVNRMKKKAEGNLKASLARSISDPEILERTWADDEAMALFREVAVGSFFRMAERIAGTRNDIRVTQTRTYPLRDVAVPTLVVHGSKDPLVPFEQHGRKLAEEIPGARLFLAEGGEHVTIFTHRREVRERVATFFREVGVN